MLDELVVRNLGVIEDARIHPGPGLTVITGETGAGKTLLVGALRLLQGSDSRPDLIGPFSAEAVIEARFLAGASEVVIGKRMQKEGRSRAYLNGSLASARAVAEAVAEQVDLIGQHDQLSLTRPAEVLSLVDSQLDRSGIALLGKFRTLRDQVEELASARDRLGGDRRALARELDLLRFQAGEIERAGFKPGDDAELTEIADRLRHASQITERLAAATAGVDRAANDLGWALEDLRKAAQLDPGLTPLAEAGRLGSETIADWGRELRHSAEAVVSDPEQQELVESRLTLLGELRRKYGGTVEEVLTFGKEAGARGEEISTLLERAGSIDTDLGRLTRELEEIGDRLRTARARAGERLVKNARRHLLDLGLIDPTLQVEVGERVRLLFASDRRLEAGEASRVASGGELSRLVLSLRLASGVGSGSSAAVVFDEIDAGLGGATALAMGRKLDSLAADRQVMCVTHLPQVAAFAAHHLVVERQGARAEVRQVEGDQRTVEVARMLAGLPDSERGREAAAELLDLATSNHPNKELGGNRTLSQ
ncbi:MAG: AAA family ATPase [Actinomycetota bacterium]